MIEMRISGVVAAQRRILGIPMLLGAQMHEAMQRTMEASLQVMDDHTPVRTGELKSNNQGRVTTGLFTDDFKLWNDTPYAGYVELGTRFMVAEPFLMPAFVFGRAMIMSEISRVRLV